MLCFRLIYWTVVFVIFMIPGTFFFAAIGRLAGFKPGRKAGAVETAFSWVGLVISGSLMLAICLIAGLLDWGISVAVHHAQDAVQHFPPPAFPQPQPFPPPGNPHKLPPQPKPTRPRPIRPEWVDAKLEKAYLTDLPEFNASVGWGQFGKNGKLGYHVGGTDKVQFSGIHYPSALSMHPPSRGFATVKYRLPKDAKLFVAHAALSDTEHPGLRPESPAVFEVHADNELLWHSKPIQENKVSEKCRLGVEGVQVLELQVHCNDHFGHVRAIWLEPHFLK
jgi:hypothetical protein